MFGSELLVAPVTKPGNGKPVKTEVFLPAGDDWFDYFTGDIYEGGRKIVHECPISRMPLFVRAGSIVPTGPKMDYTDQSPVDPLTLDVYAGRRAAEFKLYEDDGTSLDYRNGASAITPFRFAPATDLRPLHANDRPRLGHVPRTGCKSPLCDPRSRPVETEGSDRWQRRTA